MNDQQIEAEIQARGLTAPRVTPADIEANVASEHYFTAANVVAGEAGQRAKENCQSTYGFQCPESMDLLTFCVLVMKNGFTVTGESACASPENFDAEIGRKIARQNAVQKIWPLMGYALKDRLHQAAALTRAQQPPVDDAHVAPGCELFSDPGAKKPELPVIEPGSIVKLKSGGPDMVAGHTNGDGMVCCTWYVGMGEINFSDGWFHPATLKITKANG